jgi:hypothetical protein
MSDESARVRHAAWLMGQLAGMPGMLAKNHHDWSDAARGAAQVLLAEHMKRDCPGAVPMCVRLLPPIRQDGEAAGKASPVKDGGRRKLPVFCPAPNCGAIFTPKRSDQVACSARCRQRLSRARHGEASP